MALSRAENTGLDDEDSMHSMNGSLMTRRDLVAGAAAGVALASTPGEAQTRLPAEVEVVIVGAGAAGIACARRLVEAGRQVLVLEAKDMTGGRCISDAVRFDRPMDLGAHWVHAGAANPILPHLRATGLELYPVPEAERVLIRGRALRESEREAFAAAMRLSLRAILAAGRAGREVSIAEVLPPETGDWRATVEFLRGAWDCGKDVAEISCVDFFNAIEADEFFVRQGFGTALSRLADGLPVRLSTPVTRIDWSGRLATVETAAGTVRARAVVVTVSTGVLAAGAIRFSPALPRRTQDAIAGLSMGAYEHIIVEMPGNPMGVEIDEDVMVRASDRRTAKALARIGGTDWWYLDIGGAHARDLARQGADAMRDFAIDWLQNEFGVQARRAVTQVHATSWTTDPFIRGSWSVAAPGATRQRPILAEPLQDRLIFAGEATDTTQWGTVGGAWASGQRAAERVLGWLGPARGQAGARAR